MRSFSPRFRPRLRLAFLAPLLGMIISLLATPASAWWWKKDTYTETRYPIVLVNGMFGFDTTAFGLVEYWYKIPRELEKSGAEVYVAQVSGLASTEQRGLELLAQLEELQAITGAEGFNLIGHSHGGPTSRFVAGVRPDLVKSVTSVGSPHKGSPVADLVLEVGDTPVVGDAAFVIMEALSGLINLMSNNPTDNGQDATASLQSLSSSGSADFNQRFPAAIPSDCGEGDYEVDGIRYYSWGGTQAFTNPLDPSDYFFSILAPQIDEANDGLVGRCSSHMGMVIRDDYRMNHIDETNLLFGLHSLLDTDPVAVYRQHANRLQNAGL
ncbi:esterase/lipase family protein [Parendozoicomonas haliclonae]|uniref:Lactonizing lipase n=1 Tax=Parendozoicomonas haliclonae TaxID=1960125 RepID=A0A1X7APM1_9GAMM|nr:triacylglycerol lipase [Parendozoicomonas haliclonae]SMA50093.1 Lactonizing lipase precursor [Parendozoicomonas haliclonae]